jgi:DNA-binding NarL/FixJ family response regulator
MHPVTQLERPSPVRVLVADDDALVRRVVARTLARDGCTVVAEATDRAQLLAEAARHRPGVVVVDAGRPAFGAGAVRELVKLHSQPGLGVLVLTTREEDDVVLRALADGASGYLLKNSGIETLAAAVRAVAAGHVVLPRPLARRLVDAAGGATTVDASALPALTRSERLVLGMVAEGMTTAQIARRLSVTPSTVKSHVSHLLGKLDVQDRVQAVVLAYRHGLVPAPRQEGHQWRAAPEGG